jgi:hypothetical protein
MLGRSRRADDRDGHGVGRRRFLALTAAILMVVLSIGGIASRTWASSRPASRSTADLDTLAVLSEHLGYEAALIDGVLPRLDLADARIATEVRDRTSSVGAELTAQLLRLGYPPAQSQLLWRKLIGDGAAPPSPVLRYVCSVHALQSDHTELDAAPPDTVGAVLGEIELTLMVEGRQLAARLPGAIGAATDESQRDALHLLSPLLIPTDRAFAATS